MELIDKMLSGDKLALARLITKLENRSRNLHEIMRTVYPYTGNAYCLGVTGPPGAGKSTVVDELTCMMRGEGLTVGIVAVDPTSPFSGGALLGDRIRMQKHYLDDGVFIRSMATRGSFGGLTATAKCVIRLLDAFGMDVVIVETVGVGQTELDIIKAADTVLVTLVPEAGDSVQAMKAGLMEIADIFVVNKADRDGAKRMAHELKTMLSYGKKEPYWQIPVVQTQANTSTGIKELYGEITRHRKVLCETGQMSVRRQRQREGELLEFIEQRLKDELIERIKKKKEYRSYIKRIMDGELDPYTASAELFDVNRVYDELFA
ncbi:MAG: methylmalonyl Co-A mutase-associated GTPase MeaB [Thermodesulfobacteriota bacterium]|nr:methylmalonyl Co-A mutase-associated GTPase MeaB [Thermodesulfobacteriota bacterium]